MGGLSYPCVSLIAGIGFFAVEKSAPFLVDSGGRGHPASPQHRMQSMTVGQPFVKDLKMILHAVVRRCQAWRGDFILNWLKTEET